MSVDTEVAMEIGVVNIEEIDTIQSHPRLLTTVVVGARGGESRVLLSKSEIISWNSGGRRREQKSRL